MNPNELEQAFEQATAAGDFESAYAIEQQLKGLPQEQRSILGNVGRQLGLTGRAIAGGAAQIAEPFTEPVRYLMNKVLPGNPIGNIEAATDEALTAVGVPEPQGAIEEGVQDVGRFATGFATGFGAGKADDAILGLLGLSKHVKAGATSGTELRSIADAAYKVADDANVVIKPERFKEFFDGITETLRTSGFNKGLHPRSAAALRQLKDASDAGQPITLKEVEVLRRVIGGAGKTIDPDEVRIANILRSGMDDYTNRLSSSDVISGDPKVAMAALKTARNAWHRLSKSDDIQNAIETAGINAKEYSGAKFENALRTQFQRIWRDKKRMRGFSPEEQKAIKKVVMGGKIQNGLRALGNLAPTNIVSLKGAAGGGLLAAGYASGGLPAAAAIYGTGAAAKAGARKITDKTVDKFDDLVRTGAPVKKGAPDWLLPWLSGTTLGTDTQ